MVVMKLLIASSQQSLYQWIGTVLDTEDSAVLTNYEELVAQFKADRYDTVLIDAQKMPKDIEHVISGIREIATRRWIPIVVLTDEMHEEKLSSVFAAGADDIILSSYPSWLLKAKLSALGRVEKLQSELQVAKDHIEQLSLIDSVTHLSNHRGVMAESVRLCGQANRDDTPLAAVMIQIDHFNRYVEEHGDAQGQELFRTLAMLVEGSSSRPMDFVGRYDENILVLLLPETDNNGAQKVAAEILRNVREAALPFITSPDGVVTVSVVTRAYVPDVTTLSIEQMLGRLRQGLHEVQTTGYDQAVAI